MKIIENHIQDENQIILVGDSGLDYLVNYEPIIDLKKGLGYIDHNTQPDGDDVDFNASILDCFVCGESLEFIHACTPSEKIVIKDYIIQMVEDNYEY